MPDSRHMLSLLLVLLLDRYHGQVTIRLRCLRRRRAQVTPWSLPRRPRCSRHASPLSQKPCEKSTSSGPGYHVWGHWKLTILSCPTDPDVAPVIHSVDIVNSTLVKVTWSSVPKGRVHGRLKGYQVSAPDLLLTRPDLCTSVT